MKPRYLRRRWKTVIARLGLMHIFFLVALWRAWMLDPAQIVVVVALVTGIVVNAVSIEFIYWRLDGLLCAEATGPVTLPDPSPPHVPQDSEHAGKLPAGENN
jgi:hypothetical protein